MPSMNANALFVGAISSASFHQAILLTDATKRALRDADMKIRSAIRDAADQVVMLGRQMQYATESYRTSKQDPLKLDVRFLLQGSQAYDTAVDPVFVPPQQCDRDTGVYVKTSFVSRNEPGLGSKKFFDLVEKALQPLCDREGWVLKKKKTCVRVELNTQMHIDLPLYAIPDDEFSTLEKSIRDATGQSLEVASSHMLKILEGHRTIRIPTDRIMLAHREEGWVQSDPRALHDWFEEQFQRYGPQVRRQSRYFKGWRDYGFDRGGPSSIALMVCIANCYREGFVTAEDGRDDLAFHQISMQLPHMISGEVRNPVLEIPADLNTWDDVERSRYLIAANDLESKVESALNGHYCQDLTVQRLQSVLGKRVPNRPDLVKAHTKEPKFSAPASVAAASPLPNVRRTTSG